MYLGVRCFLRTPPTLILKEINMETKPVKYTEEFVLSELEGMLDRIEKDEKVIYKGQLQEGKDYDTNRFGEWAKDFKDNKKISGTIRKINALLESRVVIGAINKKFSSRMVMFHLANNFDWRNKSETKMSGDKDNPLEVKVIKYNEDDNSSS